MNNTPKGEWDEAATGLDGTVRFVKILVTTLTSVTIIGLIVLVSVIVMRFQQETTIPLPDQIVLPKNTHVTAFTRGTNWLAVVTDDDQILILSSDGKTVLQEVQILP